MLDTSRSFVSRQWWATKKWCDVQCRIVLHSTRSNHVPLNELAKTSLRAVFTRPRTKQKDVFISLVCPLLQAYCQSKLALARLSIISSWRLFGCWCLFFFFFFPLKKKVYTLLRNEQFTEIGGSVNFVDMESIVTNCCNLRKSRHMRMQGVHLPLSSDVCSCSSGICFLFFGSCTSASFSLLRYYMCFFFVSCVWSFVHMSIFECTLVFFYALSDIFPSAIFLCCHWFCDKRCK